MAPNKDLTDPSRRAALTDLFQRLAAEFAWGNANPSKLAEAVSKEEGISTSAATSVIGTFEYRIVPVAQSDIDAEQSLAGAFLSADQIAKSVNVSQIVQNILPTGFDSTALKVS